MLSHPLSRKFEYLFRFPPPTGVDTEIMPLLDEIIEIPMYGAKNSLNIAACAPVVLYEILRQWNGNK